MAQKIPTPIPEQREVKILAWPELDLAAKQDIPLCLKICEPICVKSTYTISIDIFDRPVALIRVQGETRLEACPTVTSNTRIG